MPAFLEVNIFHRKTGFHIVLEFSKSNRINIQPPLTCLIYNKEKDTPCEHFRAEGVASAPEKKMQKP